ncbi:hypothetical protein DPMN_053663 [Dreissena polymorpha]|uniref:Uncharacterized protein n=1 Tax=Dreissena polymorpha TaxID=45954 RepID=A0A9D4HQX4_DREPO|nr:hypothetical protein DPMN_053663 [Dreissena polymorpha]
MGSFGFAKETERRRDSIGIQGIRVRYPSSLRIDPLVLLRAQCIAPIHARITWVSYQYISSWVGNTLSISEISSARPGIEPGTSGMVDQSVTTRPPQNPNLISNLIHRVRN